MSIKNNRLVLINTKDNSYTVYEGKVALATYVEDNTSTLITCEVIEEIRTGKYDTKA